MAKLLVIDDETATVEMLSTYLQLKGYETAGAYTGQDGLVIARREQPALIILDLMMPFMDGYDVCRQIRSDPSLKDLPIVIVSARTDQKSIDRAMAAGANAYLTKPLDFSQLIAHISQLIS
ncbi:MAG: response regulator [Chloroflexi bacterium]|nr:response regulator [Chloroflexota bacterium]